LHPDLSIASPFVITFVMEAEEQTASQGEATRKYMDRDKKANSAYAKMFPAVTKQAQEWKEIRERLNGNDTCLVRYFFNITAFCPDDDEAALACEQQVLNTFRKNGIELISPDYMQFRNWMAMLPFIHAEGLWDDIRMGGATCRAESRQVVNLAPVVADNRLCSGGLLVPSYRNQLAFLDIYGDGMGNTNYNMAVSGTSGAGKTNLVQPIMRSVLESGGIGWVFDMLRINDTCSFHRLFVDPLSRAMFSSQGKDFEFIQQRRREGVAIHNAVYELAWRNFPEEMEELENWEMAA
ncbi:TraC family protein, partial [Enterobacter huaxiensis]|uniref:TraC family protein n=1 Tax=Enterobacter huaxiensis TaxID=2494702 RepID=UPI0021DA12D4